MELLILELIWWGILILFFWALRGSQAAPDMESMALLNDGRDPVVRRTRFRRPRTMREPIGTYQDQQIYRYVVMDDGRTYQFDRVCPPDLAGTVDLDELYVAPGLVYQECASSEQRVVHC
jgi:hypothetical protein